jgi:hypothetical protein
VSARNIACALGICFLPVIGRLGGAGNLAFTMYSSAALYRIDITAKDASNDLHAIAPTSLVPFVSRSVAPFLAGADHFRRNYETAPLRDHLKNLARIACDANREEHFRSIEIVLTEHPQDAEQRITRSEISCDD